MSEVNQYQSPQSQVDTHGSQEHSIPAIFGVSGRIGRLRFLAYYFGMTLLVILALGIIAGIASVVQATQSEIVSGGLVVVFYLFVIVYSIMLAIQRCHDFDTSGWLAVLMLIPVVNFFFFLVLIFVPGTKGTNNYGHQPVPNHAGIVILALMFPVVWTGGLLAAIAIPAYQGYIEQSRKAEQQQQDVDAMNRPFDGN